MKRGMPFVGDKQMYIAFIFHIRKATILILSYYQILFEDNICVGRPIKSPIYSARDKRKCCKHSSRL